VIKTIEISEEESKFFMLGAKRAKKLNQLPARDREYRIGSA
jgi:hypothetical protein